VKEGSRNIVLWVEPRKLGVVGISGAPSYGVLLASAWILWVEWAWLDYMCLHHEFYDNIFFSWHFQLWYTGIYVCSCPCYVFVCVCEYGMSAMYVIWWYVFAWHTQKIENKGKLKLRIFLIFFYIPLPTMANACHNHMYYLVAIHISIYYLFHRFYHPFSQAIDFKMIMRNILMVN